MGSSCKWLNALRPIDTRWHQETWPLLIQEMLIHTTTRKRKYTWKGRSKNITHLFRPQCAHGDSWLTYTTPCVFKRYRSCILCISKHLDECELIFHTKQCSKKKKNKTCRMATTRVYLWSGFKRKTGIPCLEHAGELCFVRYRKIQLLNSFTINVK